jgi:hypothetical protein
MNRLWLMGLWMTAWATGAAAAEPRPRLARDIELPPRMQEELVAVPLDSDVYAAAQSSLADLRVLDSNGREVGFLLRPAPATKTHRVRRTWTPRQRSLRPLPEEGLEITVHLDASDPVPEGLRLATPLTNFEQHVQVSSSADGVAWTPLTEALLFDYSRYMDVRNDRVTLPRTTHRHFRIVVARVTAEQESELLELTRRLQGGRETDRSERVQIERRPFRIDQVEFWTEQAEARTASIQTTEYPIAGFTVTEDVQTKTTRVLIETRSPPLTSFTLETPDRNFSRRASVEVEQPVGPQSRHRTLSTGQLTRLEFRKLSTSELTLEFPETRAEQYRILIENRDSPPLTIERIIARGPVYEVVFLAVPETTYRLAYGGEEFTPPSYDTAAIQAALRERTVPLVASLRQAEAALPTQPAGARQQLRRWFNDTWLLTGVIVVLVAALGWGLYQAARRVDQASQD